MFYRLQNQEDLPPLRLQQRHRSFWMTVLSICQNQSSLTMGALKQTTTPRCHLPQTTTNLLTFSINRSFLILYPQLLWLPQHQDQCYILHLDSLLVLDIQVSSTTYQGVHSLNFQIWTLSKPGIFIVDNLHSLTCHM